MGRSSDACGRSLRVVDGGRPYPRPRLVVIDIGTVVPAGSRCAEAGSPGPFPVIAGGLACHGERQGTSSPRLSPAEVAALRRLIEAGASIAAVSARDAAHAVREAFVRAALPVEVLEDRPATCERPFDAGQDRADALAACCERRVLSLHDAAVVAGHAADCAMMLEAGIGLAVEDAGYEACTAADAAFTCRADGGLAAALAWLAGTLR